MWYAYIYTHFNHTYTGNPGGRKVWLQMHFYEEPSSHPIYCPLYQLWNYWYLNWCSPDVWLNAFLLHLYGLHCSIFPNTVAKKVTIRNFHIYFLDKSLVKVPKTNLFCFILLYCLWSKFLFYLFIWLFNVLHFVHNKQCFEQATGLFNPIYGVSLCM